MARLCLGGDITSCKYSLQALLQKHLTVMLGEGVMEIKEIIWHVVIQKRKKKIVWRKQKSMTGEAKISDYEMKDCFSSCHTNIFMILSYVDSLPRVEFSSLAFWFEPSINSGSFFFSCFSFCAMVLHHAHQFRPFFLAQTLTAADSWSLSSGTN